MWPEIRVARSRLYEVAVELRRPFAIPGGVMRTRRSLVVELEDEDGAVGQGESAPFEFPFYSAETMGSARFVIELLLSRLTGGGFKGPGDLNRQLRLGVRGNEMALAGVETAGWDLLQRKLEVPLTDLISRRLVELDVSSKARISRSHVTSGMALGIPEGKSLDLLMSSVERAVADGYRRIKLKVEPGWDVMPASAVLDKLGTLGVDIPVTVDANGAFDPERDVRVLHDLDGLGLLFIEQPFRPDALLPHVRASKEFVTPICLDETLTSASVARQLVELRWAGIWNIKLQRVGGLEEACRIYAAGVQSGVGCWVGTMPESGLGAQFALALGSFSGFGYPTDVEPSRRWFAGEGDLITIEMDPDGRIAVPGIWSRPVIGGKGELIGEF